MSKYQTTITFDTKQPNRNGRIYNVEALSEAWEDPIFKEQNANKAIPVKFVDPITGETSEILGTGYVSKISEDGATLDVDVTLAEAGEQLRMTHGYCLPYGTSDFTVEEKYGDQEVTVVHNYNLIGFFLSNNSALLDPNCGRLERVS